MAHKSIGGWIVENKLFVQINFSSTLWTFTRKDESKVKQTHLFFLGWYDNESNVKLFSLIMLWISFQIGTTVKKSTNE